MSFQPAIFNMTHQAEDIRILVRDFCQKIRMQRDYEAMVKQLENLEIVDLEKVMRNLRSREKS